MKTTSSPTTARPAIIWLTSTPKKLELSGRYDPRTETWSNRRYESAAEKKHNEAM
jgi:hypothetical protein